MAIDGVAIGMGYVGLSLAYQVVHAGLRVVGLDVNAGVVAGLNSRVSHVDDLSHADYDIDAIVEHAQYLFDTSGVAQDGARGQRL